MGCVYPQVVSSSRSPRHGGVKYSGGSWRTVTSYIYAVWLARLPGVRCWSLWARCQFRNMHYLYVTYTLKMKVVSQYEMYYDNNYRVRVKCGCCTLCFRWVSHDERDVSSGDAWYAPTWQGKMRGKTKVLRHVLGISELIDSTVQSITNYVFAYVLSRAWKNNWAAGMKRYVFSLDVAGAAESRWQG